MRKFIIFLTFAMGLSLVISPAVAHREEMSVTGLTDVCEEMTASFQEKQACMAFSLSLVECANRLHRLGPDAIFAVLFAVSGNVERGLPFEEALDYVWRCTSGSPPFD